MGRAAAVARRGGACRPDDAPYIFVVQGGNDPRVPLSEAVQMVETVRKNGTPVWYLMAKDEGHGFGKKKNRDFQLYATALFVKNYLLGETSLATP